MRSFWEYAAIVLTMSSAVLYMAFIPSPLCPCLVLFGGVPGPAASSVTWTPGKIRRLARDPRMLDVVGSLANSRATELQLPQVKEAIDAATEADIRRAIFRQVGRRKPAADQLYNFAACHDGSTCSAGTAGASGLEDCASTCAAQTFLSGSCYTLCSLAVSPCGGRPFSLASTGVALATGAKQVRTLAECVLQKLPYPNTSMNASYFLHKLFFLLVDLGRFGTHVFDLLVWVRLIAVDAWTDWARLVADVGKQPLEGVPYDRVVEFMVDHPWVAFCVTVTTFMMFSWCWTRVNLHARRPTPAMDVRGDARDCRRARSSTLPARTGPLHAEAWRPWASSVG